GREVDHKRGARPMFHTRTRSASHWRNRRSYLGVLALALCGACGAPDVKWEPPPSGTVGAAPRAGEEGDDSSMGFDDEADFATYADGLVDELWEVSPAWGRQVGLHAYDGRIANYSKAGIAQHIAVLTRAKSKL